MTLVDGPGQRRPAVVILSRKEAGMLADQQPGPGYVAKVCREMQECEGGWVSAVLLLLPVDLPPFVSDRRVDSEEWT
ncbi:hypothetical protein ANO14919_008060 [Xylariales sp. No.14919]|nr:hypothetical protein ANO14919_008060 [Xylariales sp. No.14919]